VGAERGMLAGLRPHLGLKSPITVLLALSASAASGQSLERLGRVDLPSDSGCPHSRRSVSIGSLPVHVRWVDNLGVVVVQPLTPRKLNTATVDQQVSDQVFGH